MTKLSKVIAETVFLLERMLISKAEANLLSLNLLKKRIGRGFPFIEIK